MGACPSLLIPSAATLPSDRWPVTAATSGRTGKRRSPRRLHDRRNLLLFRVNGATTSVILRLPLHVFGSVAECTIDTLRGRASVWRSRSRLVCSPASRNRLHRRTSCRSRGSGRCRGRWAVPPSPMTWAAAAWRTMSRRCSLCRPASLWTYSSTSTRRTLCKSAILRPEKSRQRIAGQRSTPITRLTWITSGERVILA